MCYWVSSFESTYYTFRPLLTSQNSLNVKKFHINYYCYTRTIKHGSKFDVKQRSKATVYLLLPIYFQNMLAPTTLTVLMNVIYFSRTYDFSKQTDVGNFIIQRFYSN